MRVLLDESLPRELADELPALDVRTVSGQGWSGLSNGELLQRAGTAGVTVLVTADQSIPHQQNLAALDIAVIVLRARRNRIQELRPLIPQLLQALQFVQPGQVLRLGARGS